VRRKPSGEGMTEEQKRQRRALFQAQYRELLIELATNGTKDRALRELAKRQEVTRERARQILLESAPQTP
jgi:DNA-directed RNA polymerase sigma subunit (sigma70/sigma32)